MKTFARVAIASWLLSLVCGCCCPERLSCVADGPPVAAVPPARKAAVDPGPPADEQIAAALAGRRIKGLAWHEVSLDQAATYLRTITGTEIVISPKVREEKLDGIVISAELDDVTVSQVLDVVLTAPWGLRWEVRDGAIQVMLAGE